MAIIATSGPVDPTRLEKGVKAVKSLGLRPLVMESCRRRHGFLAGPDDVRLHDLHKAFAMQAVRGIFVARGGYGAARLLPYIDFELIRKNPKVFVGYSDVTALLNVISQRCGFVTFHGPMPAADLWQADEFTLGAFKNAVFEKLPIAPAFARTRPACKNVGAGASHHKIHNPPGHPLTTIVPGKATGQLTGGNLTLLAASLGTPCEIDTKGRILFLEEIGEDPYRVDRLLLQLQQAGKLQDAAGIILCDFSPQTLESLHISINEIIKPANKPTIAGLKCGHTMPNITLPIGAMVAM